MKNASHEVSLGLVSSFEGGWSIGGLYEVPRPCILVLVLIYATYARCSHRSPL